MNQRSQFDDVALEYDSIVQRAIGASGESVAFFAELKVRLMSEALRGRQPESILDFGCGIGNGTRALSQGFDQSRIVAFDVSSESVAAARRLTPPDQLGRISYVSAADGRLPVADAAVSVAFTSCVFHHIEPSERTHWVRELRRVVEPGGCFFIFEHNPLNPLTRHVVRNIPFDEGVVLLGSRDAARMLASGGFSPSAPHFYFFFPAALRALRSLEPLLRRVPLGGQYFVIGR